MRLNAWSKPTTTTSRAFTVSTARQSGHASPQLLGEGGKSGEVPTDINQSTGLERMQTLGFLEGVEVFDSQPLDSSRIGTLDNPVLVYSLVCSLSFPLAFPPSLSVLCVG
jgi:cytochrome c oxidase subunit 5b